MRYPIPNTSPTQYTSHPANPFARHPENRPVKLRRTSRINILRGGHPIAVNVVHDLEFDGESWGWHVRRVHYIGTRRRYALTYREQDRAAFTALAAVA